MSYKPLLNLARGLAEHKKPIPDLSANPPRGSCRTCLGKEEVQFLYTMLLIEIQEHHYLLQGAPYYSNQTTMPTADRSPWTWFFSRIKAASIYPCSCKTESKPGGEIMAFKCYVIQFAPPITFERVNIGVLVSDGSHHMKRHVSQTTLELLLTIFSGKDKEFIARLISEDWQDDEYWPELDDFGGTAYAMSIIKFHSSDPIRSIEDQPKHGEVSLEQFGERMFRQFCELPREGIWGNDPRAIAARGNKSTEGQEV